MISCSLTPRPEEEEEKGSSFSCFRMDIIIGASVNEPHSGELNCNFSHNIIIWRTLFRIFLSL